MNDTPSFIVTSASQYQDPHPYADRERCLPRTFYTYSSSVADSLRPGGYLFTLTCGSSSTGAYAAHYPTVRTNTYDGWHERSRMFVEYGCTNLWATPVDMWPIIGIQHTFLLLACIHRVVGTDDHACSARIDASTCRLPPVKTG